MGKAVGNTVMDEQEMYMLIETVSEMIFTILAAYYAKEDGRWYNNGLKLGL